MTQKEWLEAHGFQAVGYGTHRFVNTNLSVRKVRYMPPQSSTVWIASFHDEQIEVSSEGKTPKQAIGRLRTFLSERIADVDAALLAK